MTHCRTCLTVVLLLAAVAHADGPRLHFAGSVHGDLLLSYGLYGGGGLSAQVGVQLIDEVAIAAVGALSVVCCSFAGLYPLAQVGIVVELTPIHWVSFSLGARWSIFNSLITPVGIEVNLPGPPRERGRASWRIGLQGSPIFYLQLTEGAPWLFRGLLLQVSFGFALQ